MAQSWREQHGGHKAPAVAAPELMLHPLHDEAAKEEGCSLGPLPSKAMAGVFSLLGGEEPVEAERLTSGTIIRLEGRKLVARSDGEVSGEILTEVPLLLAEVRLGRDAPSGLPLLALAGTVGGTVWLVLINDTVERSWHALAMIGQAGAIRSDFAESFALAPRPLGNGSNAAIFRIFPQGPSGAGAEGLVAKVALPADSGSSSSSSAQAELLPNDIRQEVEMLSAVQGHPHVVRYHGLFRNDVDVQDSNRRWILTMECCPCGDLFNATLKGPFAEARARDVVRALLSALAHIHGRGIVHRDVKPENMLLAMDGRPVLADFGISCHLADSKQMARRCGSPSYAAPEILNGKPYGAKVDCFSSGSLLFFILSCKLPFDGPNIASMLRRTERCIVDFSVSSLFKMHTEQCKGFILTLLQRNADNRPTAAEALENDWINARGDVPVRSGQKSKTMDPRSRQEVAALALAGLALDPNAPKAPKKQMQMQTADSLHSNEEGRAEKPSAEKQNHEAAPPAPGAFRRFSRLGSLTGATGRMVPDRMFSNLPMAFSAAKKQGDTFSVTTMNMKSPRNRAADEDFHSDDDSDERHSDGDQDEKNSHNSNENQNKSKDQKGEAEASGFTGIRGQFKRLVSPRSPWESGPSRSSTPRVVPAPASPRPPPSRSSIRSKTTEPSGSSTPGRNFRLGRLGSLASAAAQQVTGRVSAHDDTAIPARATGSGGASSSSDKRKPDLDAEHIGVRFNEPSCSSSTAAPSSAASSTAAPATSSSPDFQEELAHSGDKPHLPRAPPPLNGARRPPAGRRVSIP